MFMFYKQNLILSPYTNKSAWKRLLVLTKEAETKFFHDNVSVSVILHQSVI